MFSLRTQLLPALSILTTLLTTAAAYADPGACSSGCTNSHDPSIIRRASDGTYFRFSTGGTIQIHTAPDLSGPWAFACTMLPGAAKLRVPGNPGTDLWAPDVSRVGASYYVYYSVSAFGSQESGIGLATSDTMECGTWDDVGGVGVASSTGDPYNAIDAQLWDDGGTYRLQFGSFWDDLYQVPMRNPPTTSAGGAPVQLAYEPAGDRPEEGPFMVKNGGFYYLFFSWGKCCGYDKSRPAKGQEYRIKVCRSTSATGGFVDAAGKSCRSGGGTVVLESHGNVYGPGGQSVYNDPKYGWVLVYHYVDITVGYADGDKRFGWNQIKWVGGWPTV